MQNYINGGDVSAVMLESRSYVHHSIREFKLDFELLNDNTYRYKTLLNWPTYSIHVPYDRSRAKTA